MRNWLHRKKQVNQPTEDFEQHRKENPFLPCLRLILEEILEQRHMEYGRMRLLFLDTDTEPESILDEDDVKLALDQISGDLNFLTILTDRPAYFQDYVETMYEETGLLVHLKGKEKPIKCQANVILDFEQRGPLWKELLAPSALYIPIYKKTWQKAKNLDISVPIGYNTVIVKGIEIPEFRI